MSNASSRLYAFGYYRLDPASRLLTRSDAVVTLAPKTFDLLVLMAESDGRLLSKSELMEALWKGAFVEEANLSFQVATLRKALGEEAHAWIEAVPKYGYRFTVPVQRSSAMENSRPDVIQAPLADLFIRSRSSRSWLVFAGIAALAAVVGLVSWQLWLGKNRAVTPFRVIPVTTYPGRETSPSFSPEGTQITFAWDGEQGAKSDVYVKVVGDNRALRLTNDSRPEFSPAWSPDGRHIAFCRDQQDATEIVLIPALGGSERVIARLPKHEEPGHPNPPITPFDENAEFAGLLAWFPDAETIAFVGRKSPAEPRAIFRLTVRSGEIQQLTFPPRAKRRRSFPRRLSRRTSFSLCTSPFIVVASLARAVLRRIDSGEERCR